MKLLVPKHMLVRLGQGWAHDVSRDGIRAIGSVEILGAAVLFFPAITHIAEVLAPLAAVGLVLVMVGTAVVHARRNEPANIIVNVLLSAMALLVAWGRLGPHPFTS